MQAYGAKSYDLVGHVWQRAMIILGLICIPICGVLLATEKLLLLGGQTPAVAAMTAAYVRLDIVPFAQLHESRLRDLQVLKSSVVARHLASMRISTLCGKLCHHVIKSDRTSDCSSLKVTWSC